MDAGLALVQFLHILGGAAWLGASVFASLVLLPFVFGQPIERQRDLVRTVILGPERLLIGAAMLATVMGVVRGTVFGPIRTIEALGSPYGIVWLAAIGVTVAIFAVGGLVTSPAARRLASDDALWAVPAVEGAATGRADMVRRLRLGFTLELSGIVCVLALMVVLATL
jgi:uncharacterized membrane protein